MLTKLFWCFIYFIKYIIVGLIISGIVGAFFPPAGAILGVIMLIGAFGASWKDAGEKMAVIAHNRLVKESEFEIEGFDQALRQTLRSMR